MPRTTLALETGVRYRELEQGVRFTLRGKEEEPPVPWVEEGLVILPSAGR
jgi:hypothetical protein